MDENFSGPVPIPAEVETDPFGDDGELLTLERAAGAKARTEQGFWFRLPRTGGKALVRRISSADRAAIGALPAHQQQRVLDALAKVGDQPSALRSDGSVNPTQWLRNAKATEQTIDAYCVAGFVKPRLCFSEMERRGPDDIPVSLIDPLDKRLYFLWAETGNEAAADHFRPVADEAGEPDLVVEVGGPGGDDGDATVVPARSRRGRVA